MLLYAVAVAVSEKIYAPPIASERYALCGLLYAVAVAVAEFIRY